MQHEVSAPQEQQVVPNVHQEHMKIIIAVTVVQVDTQVVRDQPPVPM